MNENFVLFSGKHLAVQSKGFKLKISILLLYLIAFYALKTGKLIFLKKSNLIFYSSFV